MKPRVFISSTYYDLKHIRNSIERFINQYGFEPVLFESGNVYFDHNQELDLSCYNEIRMCHMMILIIGGRYGAPASEEKRVEFIESYENKYISITRKEFKEAVDSNLPIFIFIDKNVYSEYYTFLKNKDTILRLIKDPESKFNFAHVDNVNIFDFIDEVKIKAILTFEKFEEIEDYLKNQFSGMFYNHLMDIRALKDNKEILNSVTELQNISNRMNEMVDEIGKSLLSESGKYEEAVQKQNEKTISLYTKNIVNMLKFQEPYVLAEKERSKVFELAQLIFDHLLNNENLYDQKGNIKDVDLIFSDLSDETIKDINKKLRNINHNLQIQTSGDLLDLLVIYKDKIHPLFNQNGLESLFKETLEKELDDLLRLPF